tara:strand:- start:317 stop:541 length:225 start_codon:yes stop_codon:yes gene_type:complete
MTTKEDRFKKLAEPRVVNALRYIRIVGNLSNKSNYAYSDEDQKKIINALYDAVRDVANKFKSKPNGTKGDTFKL